MAWHTIRSFGATDYRAHMRHWDPDKRSFSLRSSTSDALTAAMRKQNDWYVAGWKIHLTIYPADYARALPALKLFDERMAPTGLVYKYARSKRLYEGFTGEVKGKFTTIYCKTSTDIPALIYLINLLFTQEGVTPVSSEKINGLEGLSHELPLEGGYGFVRYGAFCYTNGILDLTDAGRKPMRDNRHLPYPRFSDTARLEGEMEAFKDVLAASPVVAG